MGLWSGPASLAFDLICPLICLASSCFAPALGSFWPSWKKHRTILYGFPTVILNHAAGLAWGTAVRMIFALAAMWLGCWLW